MGGRGSYGRSEKISIKSRFSAISKVQEIKEKTQTKLSTFGPKVQSEYIDYVKRLTKIDLEKSRDTQFDNRNGFNIDTRGFNQSQLIALKSFIQKGSSEFEASAESNGANRLYIRVKRKKK